MFKAVCRGGEPMQSTSADCGAYRQTKVYKLLKAACISSRSKIKDFDAQLRRSSKLEELRKQSAKPGTNSANQIRDLKPH